MDNDCTIKILALGIAATMLLRAQPASNPIDLLEQARDKAIGRLPPIGCACTISVDRKYFRREKPPTFPKSCEEIFLDRKKTPKLELDKTDRRMRMRFFRGLGREHSRGVSKPSCNPGTSVLVIWALTSARYWLTRKSVFGCSGKTITT
jgi:hypothetical protein